MSVDKLSSESEWSDPFIGLHVKKYNQFLSEKNGRTFNDDEVLEIAKELNDWSSKLLSMAIGRTVTHEMIEVRQLFFDAACHIEIWSSAISDSAKNAHVQHYIDRIIQRS